MNSDPRDYRLDIRSARLDLPDRATVEAEPGGRPFLSVMFACCNAYARVYQSPVSKTYDARCPRCRRAIVFRVGEGGTSQRAFVVE